MTSPTSIGGTAPASPPNRASTSFRSRLVGGVITLDPVNPLQPPAFTVAYNQSPYETFDLNSLLITCLVAIVLPQVPVDTACRVRFERIRPDGTVKITKVYQYERQNADPLVKEKMPEVTFPGFTGLKEVHIFLEAGPTTINPSDEILTAIIVDSIKVDLHKK